MSDGNAIPSTDKQRAPNNEMNRAKRGTEMASRTERKRLRDIDIEFQIDFVVINGAPELEVLTSDEHNRNAHNKFPFQRVIETLRQIGRPDNFYRHVALQTIWDECGDSEDQLNNFGGAEIGKANDNNWLIFELKMDGHLHITTWQIEGDAFARVGTVFHIAQQAESSIEQCDDRHADVQHSVTTAEWFRSFHVVLQCDDLEVEEGNSGWLLNWHFSYDRCVWLLTTPTASMANNVVPKNNGNSMGGPIARRSLSDPILSNT